MPVHISVSTKSKKNGKRIEKNVKRFHIFASTNSKTIRSKFYGKILLNTKTFQDKWEPL